MENVFLTSLTTPEVRQMFREELLSFFPDFQAHTTAPKAEVITGEELCKRLDLTIQTLIRWRQKGKIPFLQVGSSIRYDFNKVLEAIEVSKKKGVKA
ncbi:helix-turn-helix domain-containing protein [Pedobacter sp. P351]|uniref:helix-turn-helix domain-containing protein n=1 Tax=Pedobacter superstes TaxID=3133441 RepID=UPI00309DDB07